MRLILVRNLSVKIITTKSNKTHIKASFKKAYSLYIYILYFTNPRHSKLIKLIVLINSKSLLSHIPYLL